MKISNREMALNIEIMGALKETGKLGFAIARNSRLMRETCREYLEARDAWIRENGTPRKDRLGNETGQYDINRKQMDADLKEIADIELNVDIFTVPEDLFAAGNLTSGQMEVLLWMVEEKKRTPAN